MSRAASPEERGLQLLLAPAAVRARRREQILDLTAGDDCARLMIAARLHRVGALAYARLRAVRPECTRSFDQQAIAEAAQARVRAMFYESTLRALEAALADVGIRSLALKGPRLAQRLHGDAALREYDDLDILVDREHLDRAGVVARSLGWTEQVASRDTLARVPTLHLELRRPDGALPDLEIHWRLHWYERDHPASFSRRILERAHERPRHGLVPEPYDELAAMLLFYARDGLFGLRWPADLAAWWDRHADGGEVPALEALAGAHPALADAWAAALGCACTVMGVPQPAPASPVALSNWRRRAARRTATMSLNGDVDQIQAELALIDVLLSPRETLWPVLRRQLRAPGGDGSLWQRLAHAAKMAARGGAAVLTRWC